MAHPQQLRDFIPQCSAAGVGPAPCEQPDANGSSPHVRLIFWKVEAMSGSRDLPHAGGFVSHSQLQFVQSCASELRGFHLRVGGGTLL